MNQSFEQNLNSKEIEDMEDPQIEDEERKIIDEFVNAKVERKEYHKEHGRGEGMGLLEKALIDSLHHPTVSNFFQNKENFIESAFPYLSSSAKAEMLNRISDLEDHFENVDLEEQESVEEYQRSSEFKELFSFIHRWYQVDPNNATRYVSKTDDFQKSL